MAVIFYMDYLDICSCNELAPNPPKIVESIDQAQALYCHIVVDQKNHHTPPFSDCLTLYRSLAPRQKISDSIFELSE